MSGIELVGFALGIVPVLLSGADAYHSTRSWLRNKLDRTRDVYGSDGLIAVLLLNLLPGASSAMERIEKVLSGTNIDLSEFRKSLSSNMNMVAVAGAIVAQIAITGLSLEGIHQAHWTAAAFLVASLIFGALSVYVCFVVQQELNGLLGLDAISDWLSRPLTMPELLDKAYTISHHPAFLQAQSSFGLSPPQTQAVPQLESLDLSVTDVSLKREASALAAIMLATPSGLLGLSLNTFVFGLGIYFGCIYTGDLIPGFGKGGSLGVLIFYLIAAMMGTFLYICPQILKASERHDTKKTGELRVQLEKLDHVLQAYRAPST